MLLRAAKTLLSEISQPKLDMWCINYLLFCVHYLLFNYLLFCFVSIFDCFVSYVHDIIYDDIVYEMLTFTSDWIAYYKIFNTLHMKQT